MDDWVVEMKAAEGLHMVHLEITAESLNDAVKEAEKRYPNLMTIYAGPVPLRPGS
jgi:hypothetical protein